MQGSHRLPSGWLQSRRGTPAGVKPRTIAFRALLVLLAVSLDARASWAQTAYCSQLQYQYVAALQSSAPGSAGISIAALSQQLSQAQAAARAANCRGGFLFFGPRRSPQCAAINAEIQRLRLETAQIQRGGPLFRQDVRQISNALFANRCATPQMQPAANYRTLCVRTCDGYYFPISQAVATNRFDVDAEVCQSMYAQQGQAELFVLRSGDVANAETVDGKRYGDQAFAFLYRAAYSPTCAAELQQGLAALSQRSESARGALSLSTAALATVPVPLPRLRPVRGEDPETLANAAGDFRIEEIERLPVSASLSDIRVVGAEYYAVFLDELEKPRPPSAPARGSGPTW